MIQVKLCSIINFLARVGQAISRIYPQETGIVLPYADVHENEIQDTLFKMPLITRQEKEDAQGSRA